MPVLAGAADPLRQAFVLDIGNRGDLGAVGNEDVVVVRLQDRTGADLVAITADT